MRLPPLSLPRGIWLILGFLTAAYLAFLIGGATVSTWLSLLPAAVWSGEVWRLITYALLPFGLFELLVTAVMMVWIGSRVARVWSTTEFLTYCGICALGAGVILCLILPSAGSGFASPSVIVTGLLVAWARLFGHERVWLTPTWQVSRFAVALAILGAMLLMRILGGLSQVLPFIAAALTAWAYLTLRWRANRAQPPKSLESNRASRLEL